MTKNVVPENARQIVCMGGNDYPKVSAGGKAFLRYIAEAAGKPNPKILFVGAARGNNPMIDLWGYQSLNGTPCQLSFLNLFGRAPRDLEALAFDQDVIFIAGGMEVMSLALWREYKFDQALKNAWERGVVLSGLSFGGMVWFEQFLCFTYSSGHEPLAGLSILEGSMNAHDDVRPNAAARFRKLIAAGSMPAGYAVPENCGLHVIGRNQVKALTTDKNLVCTKFTSAAGKLTESAMQTILL